MAQKKNKWLKKTVFSGDQVSSAKPIDVLHSYIGIRTVELKVTKSSGAKTALPFFVSITSRVREKRR